MRNTYTLRALSVFLSITLLMSLFSACGAETKTPQDDGPATTVATEENIPESSDDYIITSWEENGMIYVEKIDPESKTVLDDFSYSLPTTINDLYDSPEDIQAKYPDKKVLVWSSGDFLTSSATAIPIDEINSYLDSLGKDYVICYSPISIYTIIEPTFENKSFEVVESNTIEILEDKLSSGEQIDIITTGLFPYKDSENAIAVTAYEYFILNNMLEPLDSYFDENETAKEFYDSLPEKFWNSFRRNGSIYQIGSGYQNFSPWGVGRIRDITDEYAVSEELMNKYGWDIEKPIEDQIDIIVEIIKKETSFSGVANFTIDYNYRFDGVSCVAYDGEEDKAIRLTESEEFIEFINWLYTLKGAGVLYNGERPNSFINLSLLDTFASKEYERAIFNTDGTEAGIKAYISVTSDEGYIINESGSGAGIYTGSNYKEEAFDFIILALTDPTLNDLISFGVEGVNYSTEDGKIIISDNALSRSKCGFLNPLVCSPFTNGNSIDTPDNVNEVYREMILSAEEDETASILFDFSNIGETYADVTVALNEFNIIGYDSADEALAELDKVLTEAGIDMLIDEVNAQYQSLRA